MDDVQVVRIDLLSQELTKGQFPVRYSNTLGNGGGYMLFQFYPPFTYYIGSFFYLIGFTLVKATKLTFLLSYFIAGLGIIVLCRRYVDTISTVIGMMLFLTATYFAFDVYTRGALGEFFAISLLPWLYFFFLEIHRNSTRINVLLAGVVYAIIIISHSFIAFVISFFLLLLLCMPPYLKRNIKGMIIALGVGLVLSAFFWIPVINEKQFTIYDKSYFATISYQGNFLSLMQIGGLTTIPWPFKPPFLGLGLFGGVTLATILFFLQKLVFLQESQVLRFLSYLNGLCLGVLL
jgi:uncharacterized membrane protein